MVPKTKGRFLYVINREKKKWKIFQLNIKVFSKLLEHRNTDLDSSMLKDLLFLKAEQWLSRGNLLFADELKPWTIPCPYRGLIYQTE